MHPLARKIGLLVSLFCLVLGLFLLGYNLRFIPQKATSVVINLWPILLVGAGIVLVVDTAAKRRFTRSSGVEAKVHPLPVPAGARELACRVQFSYGRLSLGAAGGEATLRTEYAGPVQPPAIASETIGSAASVTLAMSQPMFPSHFQLHNTWRLSLPGRLPLRLSLDLHEAGLFLDMRGLAVETLDVKADAGQQEIFFCRPQHSLSARLYSSSSDLTIVLPARTHARVRLLNPFCRVDYPQGDLEKRDDGSLVSIGADAAAGSIDVAIDGPIKNLVLDVEESGPPAPTGRPRPGAGKKTAGAPRGRPPARRLPRKT
jgi:hypothetical protein